MDTVSRFDKVDVRDAGPMGNRSGARHAHRPLPAVADVDAPVDPPGTRTVRFVGFHLQSVRRFAVRLFACTLAMLMLGAIVLWVLMSVSGMVGAFEKFMSGIGFSGFHLLSIQFLFGIALIATVISAFVAAMTLVGAGLYNALASGRDGIELVVTDGATAPVSAPVPAAARERDAAAVVPRLSRRERVRARVDVLGAWIAESRQRHSPAG